MSKKGKRQTVNYILGHSQREVQRLIYQAAILRPITERLLRSVKLESGMRVLDLGCGAGDVSMLVAELVGSKGSVVGIDQNGDVLTLAAERARAAGLRQITFEHVSVESFSTREPFDLAVGRYILMHQSHPVEFLQTVAGLVRPGGSIAFHEVRTAGGFSSQPPVPLWQMTGDYIRTALQSTLPHYDVADRLFESFSEAGLLHPELFCETPVGGGMDSPLYAWVAETLRSLLPQLAKIGLLPGEPHVIETLENRLREAVLAARSQIVGPGQVCAWARV